MSRLLSFFTAPKRLWLAIRRMPTEKCQPSPQVIPICRLTQSILYAVGRKYRLRWYTHLKWCCPSALYCPVLFASILHFFCFSTYATRPLCSLFGGPPIYEWSDLRSVVHWWIESSFCENSKHNFTPHFTLLYKRQTDRQKHPSYPLNVFVFSFSKNESVIASHMNDAIKDLLKINRRHLRPINVLLASLLKIVTHSDPSSSLFSDL